MLYMIIETFHPGKVKQLYKRFEEKGRLMTGRRSIYKQLD